MFFFIFQLAKLFHDDRNDTNRGILTFIRYRTLKLSVPVLYRDGNTAFYFSHAVLLPSWQEYEADKMTENNPIYNRDNRKFFFFNGSWCFHTGMKNEVKYLLISDVYSHLSSAYCHL